MGGDRMREDERRDIEETERVASATECTGLVPALTEDGDEANERALYDVHRAKRPGRMYRKR